MKRECILLIWDRIGDYHYARVKSCEELLGQDIYTADLAGTDALYKWNSITNTKHTVLSVKPAEQSDLINRFRAFRKIIKERSITTVAMPYGRSEYHVFLLYARLKGIRTVIFSESWYSRGAAKDFFKSILLKTLGQRFFVSGKRAFDHFTNNYKIQPSRIVSGYSVVDNKHFTVSIKDAASQTEKKNIVCVARYSKEKNLEMLIRSYVSSELSKKYTLLLVGDGPLRSELNQLIQSLAATDVVKLTGWVTYNELPQIYASSACFILPSTFEPWGLVVNEALAAGLPIILSDVCGCCPELLEVNKNGFSFSAENEAACVDVLNTFARLNEEEIRQFGAHSKELIRHFSPETWANDINVIMK